MNIPVSNFDFDTDEWSFVRSEEVTQKVLVFDTQRAFDLFARLRGAEQAFRQAFPPEPSSQELSHAVQILEGWQARLEVNGA